MKPNQWSTLTHFAGIDWASLSHNVAIVDKNGGVVEEFAFDHTAEGWQHLRERFAAYPGLAACVEKGLAFVVEQLLMTGALIFAIPGKSAITYRKRKAPSGTKSDSFDAWTLADALRTDGHDWQPVKQPDELTLKLRLLCRDQVALIEQRTCIINQLRAALKEYYPAALEAFEEWKAPSAWAFIERFPDPDSLARAGRKAWNKFLHTQQLARPEYYEKRMQAFERSAHFVASSGVTDAKSLLAVSLVKMLRCIQAQLDDYDTQINATFNSHPKQAIFDSLPGAGAKLAPRLLAEICSCEDVLTSAEALQCHAGTAPVSYQSGKMHKVRVRHSCNKHLRAAVHLWTFQTQKQCAWASVYYKAQRERGKSHACALRSLGHRWLKIVWKMCQTGKAYDSNLHATNQLKHGSWIFKMAVP